MEKTGLRKIKFFSTIWNADIEGDTLAIYTVEGDSGDGVAVPMSYCYIEKIDLGDKIDDDVSFILNMRQDHVEIGRGWEVVFPYCTHRVNDGVLALNCIDGDLCSSLMRFLLAIEKFNYGYLGQHGGDIAAIQDISRTMQSIGKARKLIGERSVRRDADRRESDYFSRLHRDAIDQETGSSIPEY